MATSNDTMRNIKWYEKFENFLNQSDAVDTFRDMSRIRFISHEIMHYVALIVPPVIAVFETFGFMYYVYKKYRKHGQADSKLLSQSKKMRMAMKIFLGLGITVTSLAALFVAPVATTALITASVVMRSIKSGFGYYRQSKKVKEYKRHLKDLNNNMSLLALQVERLHSERNLIENAMRNHQSDNDQDMKGRYEKITRTIEMKEHQYRQYQSQSKMLKHKIHHVSKDRKKSLETMIAFSFASAALITTIIFPPAGVVMAAIGLAATTSYVGLKTLSFIAKKVYDNRSSIAKTIAKPFKKAFSSLKNLFSMKKAHENVEENTSENIISPVAGVRTAENNAIPNEKEDNNMPDIARKKLPLEDAENKVPSSLQSPMPHSVTDVSSHSDDLDKSLHKSVYVKKQTNTHVTILRPKHLEKVLDTTVDSEWSSSTVSIRGKIAIDWACRVIDSKEKIFDLVWMHHDDDQLYHFHWHIADPELSNKILNFVVNKQPISLDLFESQYVLDLLLSKDNKICKAINPTAHFESHNELTVAHSQPFHSIDLSTQITTTFSKTKIITNEDEGEGGIAGELSLDRLSLGCHQQSIDKLAMTEKGDEDLEHLGMFGSNYHDSSSLEMKPDTQRSDVKDAADLDECLVMNGHHE